MAVTGSLVLAAASRYSQAHPELTRAQKLKPQLYFNLGRLVGYAGFGALVGWLGSTITLSSAVAGGVTVAISVLMVITGLNMLDVWQWLHHLQPRPPKWLSAKVYRLRGSQAWAVFIGGSLTFFLPCGFTQALQLYVLSQGSATQGALLLGAFALGTLPGLFSVGAVASLASGKWQRYATAGAAVLVVALGIFNFRAGWVSAGWPTPSWSSSGSSAESVASVENGVQVVDMAVVGYEYTPSRFVVKAGVPVEWRINGDRAAGCARVLVARSIGVQKLLTPGQLNIIRFTPTHSGIIPFSCSMGMTTPGAQFLVLAS
jgi:sulfite exporter TauE/SafE